MSVNKHYQTNIKHLSTLVLFQQGGEKNIIWYGCFCFAYKHCSFVLEYMGGRRSMRTRAGNSKIKITNELLGVTRVIKHTERIL